MTRKPAVGLSVVAIAIALCCSAWAADLAAEPKPAAVDAERYADFMAHEARDVQDLAAGAELQRRTFDRITPAGVAWFQPMQPAVVPFAAANFDAAFLEDLLGEERNSVGVYPLVLALDPQTRATLVRNVEGKLLATVPASKDFRWGPAGADPARVTLQVDLLPAKDVEPYLYAEDRIAQSLDAAAAKTRKPSRAGTVAARSLSAGEFGFAGVQHPTNGNFRLTVTNGTDAAEIYSCTVWHTSAVVVVTWTNEASNVVTDTNVVWTPVSPAFAGIESAWEIAATNLALTNGVGAWEDANVSSNARIRFYAATKRVDSDGDGLTDGAETFLHRTDPGVADTDGDGMPDGWEVRNGLNARSGLADSLIGWWKLDDGEGTAAVNSAQDAYHGELVGFSGADGGWTTEGRLGGALRFDGLDDWVRIAQEAMLPTGGAFTISAWVKLDGTCTSDWPEAVGDMVDATWNGYCLGGDANHAAFAMVGPTAWIQDTNSMADEWTWLALEFDGADMRLYRDGAALGDPVPATFVPATNGYVAIGNGPDAGTSERWKGLIDDVRIYGEALGTNDLADLCAAWEDPDGDGLLNVQESQHGSNPRNRDSDGDKLEDAEETNDYGTNPMDADTDDDGLQDGWEIDNGFDPLTNEGAADDDPDGDGLDNAAEQQAGTDPYLADTDGDGIDDDVDPLPATGNCTLSKELVYRTPSAASSFKKGTGMHEHAFTLLANPTNYVGDSRNITNVVLVGYVDDCFTINGGNYYENTFGAKYFTNNITADVVDRQTGAFTIDVYDYVEQGWINNSVEFRATAHIQYEVELSVELLAAKAMTCWCTNGAYDARAQLATDAYTSNRVHWSLATLSGSPASINTNGVVTFGSGGGLYRIRASSAELPACFDTMNLAVIKVDIIQPNSLWYFPSVFVSGYYTVDVAEAYVEPSSFAEHGMFKWDVLGTKGYGALGLIPSGGGSTQMVNKTNNKYVNIYTRGFSDSTNDVILRLTYTPPGASYTACTAEKSLTVRTFKLVLGQTWNESNGSGWNTFRYMYVKDQFEVDAPTAIDTNERFTDWQSQWYGETWRSPTPGSSSGYTWWQDWVSMPGPSMDSPDPVTPTSSGASTPVDSAVQTWRYGSTVSGAGDVFINGSVNLQRNLGFAVHTQ